MKVLVAGCGYVGGELAARLVGAGHEVWGLTLQPTLMPEGVRPLVADMREPATLGGLPSVDQVVFSAAPAAFDEPAYRATYLVGLENLIRALGDTPAPPGRLLFCSSMGVYGQADGSVVDEASVTEPARYSGHVMLEAEALVAGSGIPSVAVRIAGIYGAQRCRVVGQVRAGAAERTPGPCQITNLIHRDDCAGALHHLLELASPGPLYVAVDDEPVERNQLLLWLAERLGVEPPAVGSGAGASPWLRQRAGDLGKRLDNAALRGSGYAFEFPTYREGYSAIIEGVSG